MSHHTPNRKPLYLSEEETMALLDMCLTSSQDPDALQECVLRRLSILARQHLLEAGSCAPPPSDGASRELPHSFAVADLLALVG